MHQVFQTFRKSGVLTMYQERIDESGILQRQKSKTFPLVIKKSSELVEYWKRVHEETNWNDVHYDLRHGKKSNKQLLFKMIGTGDSKDYCGQFMTEGCDNVNSHPKGMLFARNRRLSCKKSECPKCWDIWLIREASRITERIDKYRLLAQREGWRNTKPIHVIVSPPKWKQNITFTELKKEMRKMAKRAGVFGGCVMFHAYRLTKDGKNWYYSPHFHIIGYGWVKNTKKISSDEGWVIKNKGVRDSSGSVYNTVGYLLSHTAIADGVSSVTWFGDLGYRAKYSFELKPDIIDCNNDTCPFCNQYLVLFELVSMDRPPPDKEWSGLIETWVGMAVETLDEMFERKFWLKNQIKKRELEENNFESYRDAKHHEAIWNAKCQKAWKEADDLILSLSN